MRKALRHSGVLLASFIVGVSLIGAAYALWYEDLTLTANVSTGTFDVDWSCEPTCATAAVPVVSLNQGGSYTTFNDDADPLTPPTSKAPTCSIGIASGSDETESNDVESNNVLTLSLGNLYPYSGCLFSFDIHNVGSVPAHFSLTSVTLDKCVDANNNGITPDECVDILPLGWPPFTNTLIPGLDAEDNAICGATLLAYATAAYGPIEVGEVPVQLHQNDEVICTLRMTLDQAAEEGVTYVFSAETKAHQWNESIP